MTDLEISKALALAIGWRKDQLREWKAQNGYVWLTVLASPNMEYGARFCYTDWAIIGPIAEKYDAYPCRRYNGWRSMIGTDWTKSKDADTPQKAIALAVIGAKK